MLDCESGKSLTDGTARCLLWRAPLPRPGSSNRRGRNQLQKLQRATMDLELRVAEHEKRRNETVQDMLNVGAMERMMTMEMVERYTDGPNAYAELRSRVAAYVGENTVQQGHAPMEIGEVEDGAQLDEVRTRRPRRDVRAPSQRERAPETEGQHGGKPSPSSIEAEKRTLGSSGDILTGQKKERSLGGPQLRS